MTRKIAMKLIKRFYIIQIESIFTLHFCMSADADNFNELAIKEGEVNQC